MFKKSFYMLHLLGTVSISSCMASNTDVLEHRKAVLAAQLGDYYYSLSEQDQLAMALAIDDADEVVTVQNGPAPVPVPVQNNNRQVPDVTTDALEHRKAVLAAQLGDYYYSLSEQDQLAMALAMDDADEVVTVQNTNVPQIFHGMTADDEKAANEAPFGFILQGDPMSTSPVHSNKRPAAYVNSDDDALAAIQAVFGDDNEGPLAAPAPKDKEEEEDVMTAEERASFDAMPAKENEQYAMDLSDEFAPESDEQAFEGMQPVPNPESPTNLRERQDDEYENSKQADIRKEQADIRTARLVDVIAEIERVKVQFEAKRKALEAELTPLREKYESLEAEVENRRGLLNSRGPNPRLQADLVRFQAELRDIEAKLPAYDDAFKQADEAERVALINLNKEKANLEKPLK